ncbi:MAG: tetratricopeptide repeat protein, partial [Clostridia bacterium]|nr:tetratricopeptide repeat protein [Clostridia bacterium]
GLQDYDRAADSLEDYLELEPEGEFAADAEDFLDLIDDDDAMFETTGLRGDDDYEDNAVNHFARSLLASGEANYAVEELEHRLSQAPESMKIREQLAIAYFVANRRDEAKKLANELLAEDQTNVLANSTLALAEIEDGNRVSAIARLDEMSKIRALAPEELHSIAVLQLDLERFEDAEKTLTQMMHLMPYDENVLHKLAYAKFMQGDAEAAKALYQKLLRIDPHDTVAKYYLNQSKHTDTAGKRANAKWIIPYQVPFSEAFRRLNHLNRMLALPHDELNRAWSNDVSFRDMLVWAISLSDLRVKRSMLSLVFTFADENAQHILRDFLLRTDQPDELKRAVFGMLKHLGAREPYMAHLNGRWIKGRVNLLELDYKLPASYEGVVQIMMQYMLGNCREECTSEAAHIFQRYIDSLNKKFPRISAAQEISFAAALEYLGRLSCGETVTQDEIGEVYRVTKSRLRNAIVKLEPFVAPPKGTE